MKWTKFFAGLALGSLVLTTGCGDLKKNDVVKQDLENSQLKLECDLDIDAFKFILEKNIGSAIGCLDKTLDLFIRVVESDRPGSLSRTALETFLIRNRTDFSVEDLNMVKAVFDINHLIFGDSPNYISQANKDKIINLAYVFNREASKNFELFESKIEVPFATHKEVHVDRITKSANIIAKELRNIFNPNRNGEVHRLDIIKLLENFSNADSRDAIEKAKKLLFAKKILIGGYNEEITHEEFYRLIYNLPKMIQVVFDLVRYKYLDIDQKSVFDLFSTDLNFIEEIIFSNVLGNRDEETLFELDQLIVGLGALIEDFKPTTYSPIIYEVKQLLMGGGAELVKGKDLKNLISHGKEIITKGQVFHQVYEHYNNILLSRSQVDIPVKDLMAKFPNFKREHLEDFSRIISKYRYLRGNFDSPYYSNSHYRNAAGAAEVAIFEYAIKIVAKKYGRATPGALGGYSFELDDVTGIINKFQEFLYDEGFVYPGRNAKTAETVTLMGSLFQYQSDKNKMLDVNELTEFAISLFSGDTVGSKLNKALLTECSVDKYNRVDPACYKKHFFQKLCSTSGSYYPRLVEWLGMDLKKCDEYQPTQLAMDYLNRSIQAARTCNNYSDQGKEEIPYSSGDSMTIFTAMLNIESTLARYDVRMNNNIMDKEEVLDAYEIYGPAIEGFINKMKGIELILARQLKREIFLYLIKHEEIPSGVQLLKFVAFDFKKRSTANRKTIASILVNIGAQGAPDTFECKWMRTPNHIPRNQEERDAWTPDIDERIAPNYERPLEIL